MRPSRGAAQPLTAVHGATALAVDGSISSRGESRAETGGSLILLPPLLVVSGPPSLRPPRSTTRALRAFRGWGRSQTVLHGGRGGLRQGPVAGGMNMQRGAETSGGTSRIGKAPKINSRRRRLAGMRLARSASLWKVENHCPCVGGSGAHGEAFVLRRTRNAVDEPWGNGLVVPVGAI